MKSKTVQHKAANAGKSLNMTKEISFDENDTAFDQYEIVDALAQDYLARYRNGERPTVEEYARRHPQYAEPIGRMFPLIVSVEKVKVDQVEAVDGRATLAGHELDRIGDFRIIREIGRGGMGIVFAARQESLDRNVAIKVLPKQSLLEDDELERFHKEARMAAAMHHSSIVPVYGTGESDGMHYLVMQLVDGESLDKKLAAQTSPLSFEFVANIGKQIADAIAYAHENDVLHRDIKPANIIIRHDEIAQISDFGLATNVSNDMTRSRAFSGSLRYLAPERLRGHSDQRSDVYSIGLTLYEMLVGQPAFEQADSNELLNAIANPATKSIKPHRPDVPLDLQTIVLKAMNADPLLRYQSANDLRDDLDRFLAGEPIVARKTSLAQRLVLWCRRDPKSATAAFVTIAALCAISVVSSIAYLVATDASQKTLLALQNSESIVNLSVDTLDGVVDTVALTPSTGPIEYWDSNVLEVEQSFLDPATLASPHSAEILESLRPLYKRLLDQSPSNAAIVRRMVGASVQHARILDQLGDTEEASNTIQRGIETLKGQSTSAQMPAKEKTIWLARLYNEKGGYLNSATFKPEDADGCFHQAIEIAQALPKSSYEGQFEIARAHVSLGSNLLRRRRLNVSQSNSSGSSQHLHDAIEILERLAIEQPESTNASWEILKARSYLGLSALATTPPDRRNHSSTAIEILKNSLATQPDNAFVRIELVKAQSNMEIRGLREKRKIKNVMSRLGRALDTLQPLREDYPDNPTFVVAEIHIRHKLSSLKRKKGKPLEAKAQVEIAIELQSSLVRAFPGSFSYRCWRALLYRSLAEIELEQNASPKALVAIGKAKLDLEEIPPTHADHPLVARVRNAISELLD